MKRAHLAAIAIPTAGLILAAAFAGPLNPPAGPVTSSYKTLQEVEPRIPINAVNTPGSGNVMFVISQPGSYYLTGNIDVGANMSGIGITSNNVTLDLRGFSINGHQFTGTGITYMNAVRYGTLRIENGFVSGLANGIDLHTLADGALVNIRAFACTGAGIIPPDSSHLDHCAVDYCGTGFQIDQYSVLNDCNAAFCTADGFDIPNGVAALTRCTSMHNSGSGFVIGQGPGSSSLDHCTASDNSAVGFNLGADSTATGCIASGSGGVGFYGWARCTILDCNAYYGGAQGIEVLNGCKVARCHTWNNGSGSAGIWVNGSGNRVEDNQSDSNGFGYFISTSGADNFVVRNTAHANTTNFNTGWNTATNEVAPVITNPGANAFSTMTAWSNVAH